MESINKNPILLPENLRGRSIHINVIPTVCNLKNMLEKLETFQGDVSQLKQWEKRSYTAYRIDKIKMPLLNADRKNRKQLIKENILSSDPNELGASCIDMYLVAYVAEKYKPGKEIFFQYVLKNGITDKPNSAQAIWQVGKGDGVFLDILNENGSIKNWDFFSQWVLGNGKWTNGKIKVHNKLVRDRIPAIIENTGKKVTSRILNSEEYLSELRGKVFEELKEYIHSSSQEERMEELADVLETIYALAEYHGTTIEDIEKIRKYKFEAKGGFKQRVYLMEVED